jgi:glycosyltransferase involved in cell wall biosynthesis
LKKLIRITTVPISLKTLLKGQHHFMSENGFEVIGVSSGGKELAEVAQNEGIRTVALEMSRTISPLKDLKSLYEFYKLCKKEKPDIVHSHTPKAGIVGMLAAKLAGVPIRLHTVAGLPLMEATGIKRSVLNSVEKITYRCATQVYPNSKGLYDFILQQKFTQPTKLKVIGNGSSNGIDTTHFSPDAVTEETKAYLKQSLGIKAEDFVFLFVGRLVSDKGINELISAFDQLTHSNAKLLLVGAQEPELDPLRPETLEIINTNSNILSVGFQNDVRPYFGISDCLVFPSYREGFPNVVMQAGTMGLPSIVTNINGCNEIIEEGVNGWIIPVKDQNSLHARMEKCFQHPEQLHQMGIKSRERMRSSYERSFVWNELLTEYKNKFILSR